MFSFLSLRDARKARAAPFECRPELNPFDSNGNSASSPKGAALCPPPKPGIRTASARPLWLRCLRESLLGVLSRLLINYSLLPSSERSSQTRLLDPLALSASLQGALSAKKRKPYPELPPEENLTSACPSASWHDVRSASSRHSARFSAIATGDVTLEFRC